MPPENEARVRAYLSASDAFLLVAEAAEGVVGMALGMQGVTDEGAGSPVPGLCYVPMVYVAPGLWGQGVGGRIVDALLAEARKLGYGRVRLGPQTDNFRAQRLYEGRGFFRTGREETDPGLDERSLQYERAL
jgi:ribosomal protein S18 acetylase RimI-like enzyme